MSEPLTVATADRVLPIRSLSNDLFADFWCSVPKKDSVLGALVRIPSGYNDAYFFDVVSAQNRTVRCPDCGATYEYRWTPLGVLLRGA